MASKQLMSSYKGIFLLKVIGLFFLWLIVAGFLNSILFGILGIPQFLSIAFLSNIKTYIVIIVCVQIFSYIILPAWMSLKWRTFRFVAFINIGLALIITLIALWKTYF
jgi:hypothetical protein